MKKQNMAKIIVIQLLIVNLIVLLGCSTKPKNKFAKDDNKPKSAYKLTFDVTCEDIMQCRMPSTASHFHGNVDFTNAIWTGTVVANLPESDLSIFTEELNLVLTPNILDIWPEAFDCKNSNFKNNFWNLSNKDESHRYYFEHPDELTSIVLKYENGKIYFKRETEYSILLGEDGTTLFEKKKK